MKARSGIWSIGVRDHHRASLRYCAGAPPTLDGCTCGGSRPSPWTRWPSQAHTRLQNWIAFMCASALSLRRRSVRRYGYSSMQMYGPNASTATIKPSGHLHSPTAPLMKRRNATPRWAPPRWQRAKCKTRPIDESTRDPPWLRSTSIVALGSRPQCHEGEV